MRRVLDEAIQPSEDFVSIKASHRIAWPGALVLPAATSFVKLAMSTLQHQRIGEKVLSRTRAFGKVSRREVKQWIIGRKPLESHSCPFITLSLVLAC
jgi:hypothetical protein